MLRITICRCGAGKLSSATLNPPTETIVFPPRITRALTKYMPYGGTYIADVNSSFASTWLSKSTTSFRDTLREMTTSSSTSTAIEIANSHRNNFRRRAIMSNRHGASLPAETTADQCTGSGVRFHFRTL